MATPAQIDANRRDAQKSTGPITEAGKTRSSRNRLSHGFNSSNILIEAEVREEFDLLLADLQDEYQPATPTEQILLEKMAQNQWLSLRAYRFQAIALDSTVAAGYLHKDLSLLIRYHQSSDRGFYKARTALLNAQQERRKSEIGFEPQPAAQPAENAETDHDAPEPTQQSTAATASQVPESPTISGFQSLEEQLDALLDPAFLEDMDARIAEFTAPRQAA